MDWDLPNAPKAFRGEGLVLRYRRILPGDLELGFLPAYHYRIHLETGLEAGHINFRVGEEPRDNYVAGHIGFSVTPEFRGNRIAYRACKLIQPFVARVSGDVIITCDPDNDASRRTIELLGAKFLNERAVPEDDPAYALGSRRKLRYLWETGA